MKRAPHKILFLPFVAAVSPPALAHHGEEPGLIDQLQHVLVDPLHLTLTVAAVAGLLLWRRRDRSSEDTR